MSISKRPHRGKRKAPREHGADAPGAASSDAGEGEEVRSDEAGVSSPQPAASSWPGAGDERDQVPTGPELLVLVPEVAGAPTFQVNRFRAYDDAIAFVRTSVLPKLLSSTHIFWAMHEGPAPGIDPAGGEALVLIRAAADRELVHIVSFVDLEAAASFARFEAKRGLDLASVMIYWAAFSPLVEELAASVMASASGEEPEPPDEGEPEPSGETLDEPEEPSGSGSKGRWALLLVAGLLLFIGGVCFLRPDSDGSGDQGGSGASAAVQSQEDVGQPTPSPTGTTAPAPAREAGDAAPAGDDPAPAPTANTVTGSTPSPPTVAPEPTPTPLARSSHVGDLDGSAEEQGVKKTKLLVKIFVHDAEHRPVAGATVSGEWTGGISGPASCVTTSDGACIVASKPLDPGGSATFTIGGIAADGLSYDSTLNHDPDGDNNGTSITVEG